jgi:3-isopropylmalate dehydratase small subunit
MNLKFLAADSYADLIFNNSMAFNQTLVQVSDAAAIQYDFPEAGLYALEVSLESDELEPSTNNTQRFLFL